MIDIYAEYKFPEDDGKQSVITLLKLGHVAYRVHDVQGIVKFYTDVLGFRVSDWRQNNFAFLRCGVDHHTVNFVKDEQQRLHHIAFEVRDWSEIHKSCDFLGKHDIHLVWGPGRHNIGHNIAIYHMNPDRVRVEFYTEMDLIVDEELGYFAPRPWHGDRPQRPKVWPKETLRNYWGFGSDPDLNKDL
jgi:catechol 2,3-dioxygenase-like lactoylglutathione lyase family enzyme